MAYSSIQWGNIIQGSSDQSQGRIGISYELLDYTTSLTVNVRVYFWSKYSVTDSSNTFYADWASSATTSKGSVSIKTTSNSGGWSTTNQVLISTYSTSYSKTSSSRTGYFSAKLTGIDNLGSGSMTASISFAVGALPKYTVTFDSNGGTITSGSASQSIVYGGSATPPTVTRTGYTFSGWSGTYTNVTSDRTIKATWKANTYTVTFDPNGGTVTTTSKSVTYNSTYGDFPTPIRENHIFTGWYTAKEGGTRVLGTNIVSITSSQTLYAQWELNGYTITYEWLQGTYAEQVIPVNTTGQVLSSIPIRSGYTFLGWCGTSDGETVDYLPGDNIRIDSDIVLYAVWDMWVYYVSFDANGGELGTIPSTLTAFGDNGVVLPETNLYSIGYKFLCWNTEPDGSGNIYYPGDLFNEAQDGGTAILFAIYINTEVYAYKNGTIECVEFIEDENCTQPYITKDGCIVAKKFVEHDNEIWISFGIIYAKSFIEKEHVLTAGGGR